MFPIIFFSLALIGAVLHILVGKTGIIETLLLYFLVIDVGFKGIYGFIGHFFRSDMVAKFIGWPAGNPFQKEIAFTNLAFGVLGILCIWFRDSFWMATVIGVSVFWLGAALVHIEDIRKSGNLNPGNAGPVLFADVLMPIILFGLLIVHSL